MDDDPFPGSGLRPITLADQATFQSRFDSLAEPLSDYTFSQLFTWGNSLRILWTELDGHLCVFANGSGDLTLLMPPIGDGSPDRALRQAFQIMDDYNRAHGVEGASRVEYVSSELLARFDPSKLVVEPMGMDYVYDTARMIDLAGGDLASKRQLKNRFLRNYEHRLEPYDPARHAEPCRQLLRMWKKQQDVAHTVERLTSALKRQKEAIACELALEHAAVLGLKGVVIYVKNPLDEESTPSFSLRGFTFGEWLGKDQSSIVIEKTDLGVKGLAQFIFSDFCRSHWMARPYVNAGDDWGLETLAWTKMSYRPARLLQKYAITLAKPLAVHMPVGGRGSSGAAVQLLLFPEPPEPAAADPGEAVVRPARKHDLAGALSLEQACFGANQHGFSKRQLQYLQQRPSALFLVAEEGGNIVGQGISLVRQHKRGLSGRIYSLAVDHSRRRQKIGQKLLAALVEGLAGRGVRRIYLEVEAGNGPAIALYERNGFRRIGVLPEYYGPARPGVHMMYEVPAPIIASV